MFFYFPFSFPPYFLTSFQPALQTMIPSQTRSLRADLVRNHDSRKRGYTKQSIVRTMGLFPYSARHAPYSADSPTVLSGV